MDERPHVHVFAEEAAGFPFQSGLMDFILYHIASIFKMKPFCVGPVLP